MEVADYSGRMPFVLEMLGGVSHRDELARQRKLTPEERLRFPQEHKEPLTKTLKEWTEARLAEHKIEPNSGAGQGHPINAAPLVERRAACGSRFGTQRSADPRLTTAPLAGD